MAVTQNWTRYETKIGWYEVSVDTALNDSMLKRILDDMLTTIPMVVTYDDGTSETINLYKK